jgi:hypothetical protein
MDVADRLSQLSPFWRQKKVQVRVSQVLRRVIASQPAETACRASHLCCLSSLSMWVILTSACLEDCYTSAQCDHQVLCVRLCIVRDSRMLMQSI